MCAVILIFAFAMSLVINLIERMIIQHNDRNADKKPGELLIAEKSETFSGEKNA